MLAITVQQPWAEFIARGVKLVENRSRRVFHRGPLAIHAGLRLSVRGMKDPRITQLIDTEDRTELSPLGGMGKVIAVAELVDCHPAAGCCKPWGDDTYNGRTCHHLVLANVRALARPVPATGRLGLWSIDLPEGAIA